MMDKKREKIKQILPSKIIFGEDDEGCLHIGRLDDDKDSDDNNGSENNPFATIQVSI